MADITDPELLNQLITKIGPISVTIIYISTYISKLYFEYKTRLLDKNSEIEKLKLEREEKDYDAIKKAVEEQAVRIDKLAQEVESLEEKAIDLLAERVSKSNPY